MRLLIVDDLAEVREGLKSLLQLASRKIPCALEIVGEAQNGTDALQKASALHPEVVLMDLEMPVMDGYEATRQIKAGGLAERIIILSIHDGVEEQARARRSGADAFFVKGGNLEELLNTILGKIGITKPFESEKGEKE